MISTVGRKALSTIQAPGRQMNVMARISAMSRPK